jgi:hypothetical protein
MRTGRRALGQHVPKQEYAEDDSEHDAELPLTAKRCTYVEPGCRSVGREARQHDDEVDR